MASVTFQIISWPVLGTALVVFGLAPGAVLRVIVLAFPRDDPRRHELLGELHAVPRIERPFWVAEQLEIGLFEGLRGRLARRRPDGRAVRQEEHPRPVSHVKRGGEVGPEQGSLFGEEFDNLWQDVGYRGPTACAAAGITYHQLDHWAQTGLAEPSALAALGAGSQQLYSFRDILVLKVIKRLLDTGIPLQKIRAAVGHLRDRSTPDLAGLTLMSDGLSVYEITTPDEVVDLLAGGQGVFGITLGRIWQEVDCILGELPGEPAAARA
jgi:DNA-binding transcriptional MerR regulator